MPSLEYLGLLGSLSDVGSLLGVGRYHYDDVPDNTLRNLLESLRELQNLTQLDLAPASELGLGFDGGSPCGNAYYGPGGREYSRQVDKEWAEAVERGTAIVIQTLPQLESFNIGEQSPSLTRYDNGTIQATFPWTGRLDEWAWEATPEPDNDDPYHWE
ncbi:hypothetical protein F5Y16DRAFT_373233 [Xylariaceae sp. FL0255]|nr:hypothetical protein F5Y16DRAFT_373233 [Xylariaceae sp. FL0255]